MNLDDIAVLSSYAAYFDGIAWRAQDIERARRIAHGWELPSLAVPVAGVVLLGAGEAFLSASLVEAYCHRFARVPVFAVNDYNLSGWTQGLGWWVIAVDGDAADETTACALAQAAQRGCRTMRLPSLPTAPKMFIALMQFLVRMDVLALDEQHWQSLMDSCQTQEELFCPASLIVHNPAKRMAGQLIGRSALIYASAALSAAANYWKQRIQGVAKACAAVEILPQANEFAMAGIQHPDLSAGTVVLFLQSPDDHARAQMRFEMTREWFMVQAFATDALTAQGDQLLAYIGTLCQYADNVAGYLAAAYQEDPALLEAPQAVRQALRQSYMQKGSSHE